MPVALAGSVGQGGKNLPDDVRLVFALFNKILPSPLPVGDQCSTELIQAILEFQKPFLSHPDGRIDVGGTTWKKLTAAAEAGSITVPAALPPLPGGKLDIEFDTELAALDLEDSGKYQFTFKTTGTSIGFKVAADGGRNSGLFLPENSATHLEGEVVAYRLARLLDVSNLFNPVGYYTLQAKAVAKFKQMLRSDEQNKWRRENTQQILRRINGNPSSLPGIYKYRHKRDSQSVDSLVNGNSLNLNHKLASLLDANGPMPDAAKLVRLPEVKPDKPEHPQPQENEAELARQLSVIFTVDMLTGQWDRFSGGNIEAYAHKDGRLQFVSRDNGGSHLLWGWNWFDKYRIWLTRFDHPLVEDIQRMNTFLDNGGEYKGLTSPALFRKAVGFSSERTFDAFKKKLEAFLKHVRTCEERFGNSCFFEQTA